MFEANEDRLQAALEVAAEMIRVGRADAGTSVLEVALLDAQHRRLGLPVLVKDRAALRRLGAEARRSGHEGAQIALAPLRAP